MVLLINKLNITTATTDTHDVYGTTTTTAVLIPLLSYSEK